METNKKPVGMAFIIQLKYKAFASAIQQLIEQQFVVVVVWKGIHSMSVTNSTGPEGLSFYYTKLL